MVNKNDLIKELSEKIGKPKTECYIYMNAFMQIVDEHLKNLEPVKLDIGTIQVFKGMKKFYAREKGSLLQPGVPAKGKVVEGLMVRVKIKTSRYKRYFVDPTSIKPIGGEKTEESEKEEVE